MNIKEEFTKLLMESYDRGVKDAKQEALTALEKVVAVNNTCEKHCEANAFAIVIRGLEGEVARLKEQLAQSEQEPDYWLGYGLQAHTEKPFENATALYKEPPQRTEQNFCSRCGKRTPNATHIHTCTPLREGT